MSKDDANANPTRATKVDVEVDNKAVAAMINDTTKNLLMVGPIIEDVKKMLQSFIEFKATWVNKEIT